MSIIVTSIFIPGDYRSHSDVSTVRQSTKLGDHLINMYRKCIVKCGHRNCLTCINGSDFLGKTVECIDEDKNILDLTKSIKDLTDQPQFTIYIYQAYSKPIIPINCEFIYGDKSYHFKYMYLGNYTLEECCDDYLEYKCKQLVQIKKHESFAVKEFKIDEFMEDILEKTIDKITGEKSKSVNLILSFVNTSKYLIEKVDLSKYKLTPEEFFVDHDILLEKLFINEEPFENILNYYKIQHIDFPGINNKKLNNNFLFDKISIDTLKFNHNTTSYNRKRRIKKKKTKTRRN